MEIKKKELNKKRSNTTTTTAGTELHQDHQEEQEEGLAGGETSCEISMQYRMPTPNVWASPGGIAPIEFNNGHITT